MGCKPRRAQCGRRAFGCTGESGRVHGELLNWAAGSDGRRNTSLIDWAHNTFNEEPLFWLSSIRPKQGCVFFKSTFANEFSLSKSGKYASTWCCIDLLNPPLKLCVFRVLTPCWIRACRN